MNKWVDYKMVVFKLEFLQHDFATLIANENISKDTVIYKLTGKILDKPTRTSIEIGENLHIEDEYGKYINHSFDPNTKIITGGYIVAIKNIEANDEITFNYNENETKMSCPFIDNVTNQKVYGKSLMN
jgi:hypothetical protein